MKTERHVKPSRLPKVRTACNLRKGRRTAEEFFSILRAETAQKDAA